MTAPVWLKSIASDPAIPSATVFVAPGGEHIGVGFVDASGRRRQVHLAFHHDLRDEPLAARNAWVVPALDPVRLTLVAAMCERVIQRHRAHGLPYGFRYDATRFQADGAVVFGPNEHGLTCATFVLAVFGAVGIHLLQRSEWKPRADDAARWDALLALVTEALGDAAPHVAALKAETTAVRFRPAEVAGGSSQPSPCGFTDAEAAALALVAAWPKRKRP